MEEKLPKIKQPKLRTQVYKLLLDLIIDGKYRNNDMLPPERQLCEELGVSRTVVREAIKSLETRGILTVIHGKGIRVNPPTSDEISDAFMLFLRRQKKEVSMKDLMEVRYSIEPQIALLAAVRATNNELFELKAIIDTMKDSISIVDKFIDLDLNFHLQLSFMTKNIIFITISEALIIPFRKSREVTVSPPDNIQAFEEHSKLFNFISSRDPEKAKDMMIEHLKHVETVLKNLGKL